MIQAHYLGGWEQKDGNGGPYRLFVVYNFKGEVVKISDSLDALIDKLEERGIDIMDVTHDIPDPIQTLIAAKYGRSTRTLDLEYTGKHTEHDDILMHKILGDPIKKPAKKSNKSRDNSFVKTYSQPEDEDMIEEFKGLKVELREALKRDDCQGIIYTIIDLDELSLDLPRAEDYAAGRVFDLLEDNHRKITSSDGLVDRIIAYNQALTECKAEQIPSHPITSSLHTAIERIGPVDIMQRIYIDNLGYKTFLSHFAANDLLKDGMLKQIYGFLENPSHIQEKSLLGLAEQGKLYGDLKFFSELTFSSLNF